MKNLFIFLFLILKSIAYAQDVTIDIDDFSQGKLNLIKYFGKEYTIIDSGKIDIEGKVTFKGQSFENAGIYGIIFYVSNKAYFLDFLYDKKNAVFLKCNIRNPIGTMQVLKSEINKEYYDYLVSQSDIAHAYKILTLSKLSESSFLQNLDSLAIINDSLNVYSNSNVDLLRFYSKFRPSYNPNILHYSTKPKPQDLLNNDLITLKSEAFQLAISNVINQNFKTSTILPLLDSLQLAYKEKPEHWDVISKYIYQDIFTKDTFSNDKLFTQVWEKVFKDKTFTWQTSKQKIDLDNLGYYIGRIPLGEIFPNITIYDTLNKEITLKDIESKAKLIYFFDYNNEADFKIFNKICKTYFINHLENRKIKFIFININPNAPLKYHYTDITLNERNILYAHFFSSSKDWNKYFYSLNEFSKIFLIDENECLLSKGINKKTDKTLLALLAENEP